MVFYVTMVTFQMTLLINKRTNIAMNDGWVHQLAKTLPCSVGDTTEQFTIDIERDN